MPRALTAHCLRMIGGLAGISAGWLMGKGYKYAPTNIKSKGMRRKPSCPLPFL